MASRIQDAPPRRAREKIECQPACKPGSVWPRRLAESKRGGHSSWTDVAIRLMQPTRMAGPETPEGHPSRHPYSVLLPAGFAMPLPLPVARWALAPPFHPYPASKSALVRMPYRDVGFAVSRFTGGAVSFLWHFPWGRPRRLLAGAVFPWSPDFPREQPFGSRPRGRPAGWQRV